LKKKTGSGPSLRLPTPPEARTGFHRHFICNPPESPRRRMSRPYRNESPSAIIIFQSGRPHNRSRFSKKVPAPVSPWPGAANGSISGGKNGGRATFLFASPTGERTRRRKRAGKTSDLKKLPKERSDAICLQADGTSRPKNHHQTPLIARKKHDRHRENRKVMGIQHDSI